MGGGTRVPPSILWKGCIMDDRLIEYAREEAAADVEVEAARRLEAIVDKAITDTSHASLEHTKHSLRKAKKRMRTRSYYLCDICNEPIHHHEEGFVFHGNVYVADPSERGGLIGNNFPVVQPGTSIEVGDVEETVLCHKCTFDVLGLKKHYTANKKPPNTTQNTRANGSGGDGNANRNGNIYNGSFNISH